MPWWWMRPPSAAQELSLGMSHWVMSHNYQWQPAIFASTRFTSTVEWPISNHIHMWLLSMLKLQKSIEDEKTPIDVWYSKEASHHPGLSSTWRHHPSPSGGETCFPTLGWFWLVAGQGWTWLGIGQKPTGTRWGGVNASMMALPGSLVSTISIHFLRLSLQQPFLVQTWRCQEESSRSTI